MVADFSTGLFWAVGVLGTFWFVREYAHHVKALESARNDVIPERKTEVKTRVNDLVNNIEHQRNSVDNQLKLDISHYTEIGLNIVRTIYNESKVSLTEKEIKRLIIVTLIP